jgi:ferric-dicitrate binding protein FerR (iron transport regulator)
MAGRSAAAILIGVVVAAGSATIRADAPVKGRASEIMPTVTPSHLVAVSDGRISFQNEELRIVLMEMNRRSDCKIELMDAEMADKRISGALLVGDPQTTARRLRAALNVRVRVQASGGRLCAKANR